MVAVERAGLSSSSYPILFRAAREQLPEQKILDDNFSKWSAPIIDYILADPSSVRNQYLRFHQPLPAKLDVTLSLRDCGTNKYIVYSILTPFVDQQGRTVAAKGALGIGNGTLFDPADSLPAEQQMALFNCLTNAPDTAEKKLSLNVAARKFEVPHKSGTKK